ncbi:MULTISPECIES: YCF48-related protein [unclassified Corallococcus]|uniref:YCF48-related protein n=1 Tax=unclassified Corallococcus TaxID=2685029 RepID=UPI001A8FAA5B|nr:MULTISPECIES: hypothetical protein [unclassified Corallococcus]MBN9688529.1 hypothetical protein [Corallococcus sp. NCSPR001]WAS87669.1 hypothetical protein O0N60_12000 [Corallococcus sp. NCRR]
MHASHWVVWAVCGVSLGCAAPRSVASSSLSADLTVEAIDARIHVVAPGPGGEWWAIGEGPYAVSNAPGIEAFRSADEGRSWQRAAALSRALNAARGEKSSNAIRFLTWFTPETGIAAGSLGPWVLRTTDAGRTWRSVPLWDEQWLYTLERAGHRTWICGSTGRLLRSDDQGASWRESTATPFNTDDRCRDLSFISPDQGWAMGSNSTLWATEDGGDTWTPLTPPFQLLRPSVFFWGHSSSPELHGVLRLTRDLAWVLGSNGLYKTTDGGRTWQGPFPSPPDALRVSVTPDGRQVLTLTPPELPVEQWIPSFWKAQAFPHDTVAVLSQSSTLTTYVSGQIVREGPMLMRGQGRLTRLDGSIQRSERHWLGWSGDQVVATHDAGQSWFRQGNTSGRSIHTLVLLENGILLAELDGGRLLRSKDDGWTWAPAERWEAHDFTVATGRNPGTEHPLACLLATSDAMLQIEFESRGCFGGSTSALELRVRTEGAHLRGSQDGYPDAILVDQRMDRTAGEQLLRKLVDAATRTEHGMRCQSTTAAEVRMTWSCGSGLFKASQRAKLTGSLCSPLRQRAEGAPEPYDRVDGVFDAARDVLEEAVSRPRTDAPGAHPGVTR